MTQPTSDPRPISTLSPKLDKHLAAYVAVASAAGLGFMAAPPEAHSEIVYTATNVSISGHATIDLNNDGIPDFEILARECGSRSICLDVNALAKGNGVRGNGSLVNAGFFGVPVGAGEKFLVGDGNPSYGNLMALAGAYGPYSWSNGPWKDTTNRYLGVRFMINGQTHYGWVRMSVHLLAGEITLTGYAYETTANGTIIEGHTSGPSVSQTTLSPVAQPATLGMLARGSEVLSLWRREEEPAQTI